MDLIEWLGRRQRAAKAEGISLRRFAASIHMSPSQLSRLLARKRPFNRADLGRLVEAYPDSCETIRAIWRGENVA